MLDDADVTLHIRMIVENADNEYAAELVSESIATLRNAVRELHSNSETSDVSLRIQRFLAWLDQTREIEIEDEPWIVVSQIINNYQNPINGMVNQLIVLVGIGLAANWAGDEGAEPDWLKELDRVLYQYWYSGMMEDWDVRLKNDIMQMSISERAACFHIF